MTFFLFWSFPISGPWGLPFLITYSGIERRSNVFTMKPRLATISFKRCPHVQMMMPSLQFDRHSLHCVVGSVSNSSNSSTLPTSWIIFFDFPLNGLQAFFCMSLIWILGSKLILWKQPIKSNSVGSGTMSHCPTSTLSQHLDHCFVVFKHIQQSFMMRKLDVWGNKIKIIQFIDHPPRLLAFVKSCERRKNFVCAHNEVSPFYHGSESCFQELKQSDPINRERWIPSDLNLASKEMISDSVELCETEVWFLHIELLGNKSRFCFFPANSMTSTYTDKNNPFFTMYKETFPIWNFLPAMLQ